MSNEAQYCIFRNGKETGILTCEDKKQVKSFYEKHYPGEQVYLRWTPEKGFLYQEARL